MDHSQSRYQQIMVLLVLFENQLLSDPLQFGFKPKSSCSHALFTFKTVVDHYVKCGSTVTVCTLDISKAFNKIDHYALLQVLMDKLLNCLLVFAEEVPSLFGFQSRQE